MDDAEYLNIKNTCEWEAANGRKTILNDLEDTHLANIINYIKGPPHPHKPNYPDWLLPVLTRIAEERKLTDKFLSRAPIPWKDVDGKWKRLNLDLCWYEVIGR